MARKPRSEGRSTAAAADDTVPGNLATVENGATVATSSAPDVTTRSASIGRLRRPPSKLDRLVSVLRRECGADMPAMLEATGWQAQSIRGALAGALKRRGHIVSSDKSDGRRVWRIHTLVQPTP